MLDHEAGVSEAVDVGQLVPIRGISVIDVQRHRLADLVVSPSDYQQQGAHEDTAVLVSLGRLRVVPVRSLHPIQPPISVFPQAPSIVQRHSVRSSPSEDDHHSAGRARFADTCRMVHPRRWIFSPSCDLLPDAVAKDIDFPDISNRLRAGVASVDDDVGFQIGHDLSVPRAGRGPLAVLDGPKGLVSDGEEIELVEVVVGEFSASERSSEDEEKVVDSDGAVRGSIGGRSAVTF